MLPRVRSLLITVLCGSLSVVAAAQQRNNHAVLQGNPAYQYGSLLSFANSYPAELGSAPLFGGECSATISDTAGNLLFSTINGIFYDRFGGVMDQGEVPMGFPMDVTQSCLIFPRPAHPSVYDVLYIRDSPYTAALVRSSWITVDMNLNGGLGAVTGNLIYGQNFSEKLTGTPHGNGEDYWAVMHEWGTNTFWAYLINEAGLDTLPVASNAGSPHTAAYGVCDADMNYQGEMKISNAGDRLALCTTNNACMPPLDDPPPSIVQLFHFDDQTGEVSYWMDLPGHHMTYGMDFSQDGSKLYVAGSDTAVHYVDQYDLNAGDTLDIAASRTRVFSAIYWLITSQRPNAMAFAPDGRLYVAHWGTSLDAITAPDAPGTECGYTQAFFLVSAPEPHFGSHWNQLKRYHDSEYKRPGTVGIPSIALAPGFAAWPNPAASVLHLSLPQDLASHGIRIHDATGRIVYEPGQQAVRTGTIDVCGLANGLYTVSLLDGGQVLGAARLVVQH